MKLAVMQPYIFPYIGYFQLIHTSDKFVFYDDVNYIKQGWVNRNRILINESPSYFSIPLRNASSNALIKDTRIDFSEKKRNKLLRTFDQNYKKAPFYNEVSELISDVLSIDTDNISELATESILRTCDYLGLVREFHLSSERYGNQELDRTERLLDMCDKEKADKYVNSEGGRHLYSKEEFEVNGIELSFLTPEPRSYQQFSKDFVSNLSIIDVLMHNSRPSALEILANDYYEV
jgi:hypothetical protein